MTDTGFYILGGLWVFWISSTLSIIMYMLNNLSNQFKQLEALLTEEVEENG